MTFEENHLFHVFNRGNNMEKLFHSRNNYLLFLSKVRKFILPYCDIVAWCLMPDHFHLLVKVNYLVKDGILINFAIGRMLSSYAQAINKQFDRKGSLFQEHTKAINMTYPEKISPSWYQSFGITVINRYLPERAYPKLCFEYIHNNPVKAGLVDNASDWEFSSLQDYLSQRRGTLINREIGNKICNPD